MKYCSECGEKLSKESRFCPDCGNKIKHEKKFGVNYNLDIKPATQGKRLINFILDYFIGIYIFAYVIGSILGILGFISGYESDEFLTIIALVSSFLYFYIFELITGRTPGKLITGTRVVMSDGSNPTSSALLRRTLARFVPFEPFSYQGPNPTGWHDTWSDTIVTDD